MEFRKLQSVVVIVSLLTMTFAEKYDEPVCTSRFDFEAKLLHKMVRMEHAMELLQERVGKALTDMERENLQIKQDVVGFKAGVKDEQTKALEELKATNEDLKQESVKLTKEIETLSQQFEAKLQRMSQDLMQQSEAKLQRMSQDLTQQSKAKLQKMSQDVTAAINKSADDKVVFAVQRATGDFVNGVPTFSKVYVNVGGAYNVSTGKFTCNVKGIYTFTFIVRSKGADHTYCWIRKNGSDMNHAVSAGDFDMPSVTVYFNLVVGDVVDLGGCGNLNKGAQSVTSFSGLKI